MQNSQAQQLLIQTHQLIQRKQLNQAYEVCMEALRLAPEFTEAWLAKSFIAFHTGQGELAIDAIEHALALRPNDQSMLLKKAIILSQVGQHDDALNTAEALLQSKPAVLQLLVQLAELLQNYQAYDQVEDAYVQALALSPNHQELQLRLATVFAFQGKLKEAEELAEHAFRGNAFDSEVYFFISHLRKYTAQNNHISGLKEQIQHSIGTPTQQAKLHYALAKELEDCGEYAESFRFRKQGAALYRGTFAYNVQDDVKFMRALRHHYSKARLDDMRSSIAESASDAHATPVFVLGMPRTGTTLLERVISSHSDVTSAGELPYFSRLMTQGMAKLDVPQNLTREQLVAYSSKLDFAQLGKDYLAACERFSSIAPYFVDKFPQNAIYAGLIHLALPTAKIVLLERHPLDVCYSVYKQLFTEAFQFSYDLNELAEFFHEHQLLMQHWQKVLPDVVKVVAYEDLVHDLETNARSVIEFCGLSWQEQCLEFHNNKQVSTTASASQVRQKIYATSIGNWRHYRDELKPLISKLAEYGYAVD